MATYKESMDKADELIKKIEKNEIDVDELADTVKQVKDILGDCRKRLKTADSDVREMLAADNTEKA